MNLTRLPGWNKRLRRTVLFWGGLLLAGLLYAGFMRITGWGIPCIFHLLTGLYCPGCGVSHMALCLLWGDLAGAFAANGAILCLLPLAAVLAVRKSVCFVLSGEKRLRSWENAIAVSMAVFLTLFGILRNLTFLT